VQLKSSRMKELTMLLKSSRKKKSTPLLEGSRMKGSSALLKSSGMQEISMLLKGSVMKMSARCRGAGGGRGQLCSWSAEKQQDEGVDQAAEEQ